MGGDVSKEEPILAPAAKFRGVYVQKQTVNPQTLLHYISIHGGPASTP